MTGFLGVSGFLDAGAVTPVALDSAWATLRAELNATNAEPRQIDAAVNGIGLSFGQLLVEQLGMEWTIATDDQGTDIAVRNDAGWLVYPRNVVRKRYANGETGFLTALFEVVSNPAGPNPSVNT
jgi:Domain of unknown function (DUF3806)